MIETIDEQRILSEFFSLSEEDEIRSVLWKNIDLSKINERCSIEWLVFAVIFTINSILTERNCDWK